MLSFGLDEAASAWTARVLVANSYAPFAIQSSPTLVPDGSHFAALQRVGSGDALPTITIYAVDPSLTTAGLVAIITLPGMHARRLVWSPDGRWLAFTTDETTTFSAAGATYAFPLAAVLPIVLPAQQVTPHPPIEAALQRAALVQLEDGIDATNAWRPTTGTDPIWTYVDDGTIWQVEVRAGQRCPLLTVPGGGICALAWTPDGQHMLFAQCRLAGPEFYPPPARLYVYTVPVAEAHP